MTTPKVHDLLADDMPAIRDSVSSINRGGCGVFALELTRALSAVSVACDIVLVQYSTWGDNEDDVQCLLNATGTDNISDAWIQADFAWAIEGRKHSLCNGHVCVQVGDKVYDSSGLTGYTAISEGISDDAMLAGLRTDCWNKYFLRDNDDDIHAVRDTLFTFFTKLFNKIEVTTMAKLTNTQANDKFMSDMRAKGMDTIFISELPFPKSTRNCTLILSKQGNLIYIREGV